MRASLLVCLGSLVAASVATAQDTKAARTRKHTQPIKFRVEEGTPPRLSARINKRSLRAVLQAAVNAGGLSLVAEPGHLERLDARLVTARFRREPAPAVVRALLELYGVQHKRVEGVFVLIRRTEHEVSELKKVKELLGLELQVKQLQRILDGKLPMPRLTPTPARVAKAPAGPAPPTKAAKAPVAKARPSPKKANPTEVGYVRVGQRWVFSLRNAVEIVWTVTAVDQGRVDYSMRSRFKGKWVGPPVQQVWRPATSFAPRREKMSRLKVGDVTLSCRVVTLRQKLTTNTTWIAMRGSLTEFPGIVRAERNGTVTFNLKKVVQP